MTAGDIIDLSFNLFPVTCDRAHGASRGSAH